MFGIKRLFTWLKDQWEYNTSYKSYQKDNLLPVLSFNGFRLAKATMKLAKAMQQAFGVDNIKLVTFDELNEEIDLLTKDDKDLIDRVNNEFYL